MRAGEVVVMQPRQQVQVAFLGVGPMANVGPFAQCGLDEGLSLTVGGWAPHKLPLLVWGLVKLRLLPMSADRVELPTQAHLQGLNGPPSNPSREKQ